MERWVCARRTVTGEPEALKRLLIADTPALLQAATGSPAEAPGGDGSFPLVLTTEGGGVHKAVSATVGQASVRSGWMQIPLRWRADPLPGLFPAFDGFVEVEDLDRRSIGLAVLGRYRPPASLLGGLADRLALSRVADGVVERIARGLVGALVSQDVAHADPGPAMTVQDVMSPEPLVFGEEMSLRGAANLMLLGRIHGAPVVDDHGQLVGVLSEADLLDKVAPYREGVSRDVRLSWRRHDAVTVGEACSRPARTTAVDATIRAAAAQMAEQDVSRLVVMRGAEVAGILTRHDVLKALVRGDAAIESAVEVVVDRAGHDGLAVDVADGRVTLSGRVPLHSQAIHLQEEIGQVDGVLAVDVSDLRHEADDLVGPPPMWA
jgi:CBS domain-containing protein